MLQKGFPGSSVVVKNLPATQRTQVQSLGGKDPLEEGMASHSSTLAWRIPWTEEPGRLWSIEMDTKTLSTHVRACTHTHTHTHTGVAAGP